MVIRGVTDWGQAIVVHNVLAGLDFTISFGTGWLPTILFKLIFEALQGVDYFS